MQYFNDNTPETTLWKANVTQLAAVHAVLCGKPLQVIGAECGDENPQLFGSLQNGTAFFRADDPIADREFDTKL